MRAGDLRRRVSVQTRNGTQDAYGQQVTVWTDYMLGVPSTIEALSGREIIAAQAISVDVTHQITVRYSSLLADPVAVAAMRLVYVNAGVTRYFNISAAMNVDERNKTIVLLASEGLNLG